MIDSGPSGPTFHFADVGVPAGWEWNDWGTTWVFFACFLALILVAFAAACEATLHQTGVYKLRKLIESDPTNGNGSRSEKPWDEQNHTRLLLTVQALHIVMLLNLGGLILSLLVAQVQEPWQLALGLSLSMGLVLSLELLARTYARAHARWMAQLLLPTGLALTRLASPIFSLVSLLLSPLSPRKMSSTVTLADDLEELSEGIQRLQQRGLLEQDQSQILQSAFQFGETIAREVMIPRVDMVCVEIGSPLRQVLDLMIQCGHTRLPVYRESVDDILGLVHAKDLLRRLDKSGLAEIGHEPIPENILREILIVPGTKKIAKILRELQRSQITMAIAVDEYGGTDGLLTLEDIVEELVGEITDEYDQANEGVQLLKDGSSVVDAKIILEDVNELLRLDLPCDEHDTLGGYVYGLFGRVPHAGETVIASDLKFTVDSVHKQRIKRVRIGRVQPEDLERAESLAS